MQNMKDQISGIKVKQIFLIIIIVGMLGLMAYNLATFIPSVLGAITLYIIFRSMNFHLQYKRKWKPMWAALFIIFLCLITLILPMYILVDMVIDQLGNSQIYMAKFNDFADKIHEFIYKKTEIDLLSKDNLNTIKNTVAKLSTTALSSTVNILTIVASMFFILYFPLERPKEFERMIISAVPLKRANTALIGDKFTKMVIANAVGIPVVAFGQGIVALVGYLIFGAPNPMLLFMLTFVASMIPIVGAAIVYVPISIYLIAEGNTEMGIGLLVYCVAVVGMTDNLLRFTILKKLENIHPLNTVFGIIMGMNIFGFMGLIFGPILVSMTILLIQIYHDEFSTEDQETDEAIEPTEEPKSIE